MTEATNQGREALTDEQIDELFEKFVGDQTPRYPWTRADFIDFARAIERASPIPTPGPTPEAAWWAGYIAGKATPAGSRPIDRAIAGDSPK
jgi:hypothetical protein